MNDTPNDETNAEKKARQIEMIKKMWLVLIPIFSIILLFKLYSWSRGKDDITYFLAAHLYFRRLGKHFFHAQPNAVLHFSSCRRDLRRCHFGVVDSLLIRGI